METNWMPHAHPPVHTFIDRNPNYDCMRIIVGHVDSLFSWTAERCCFIICCPKELWENIPSFPFVKDVSVHPMQKEIRNKASKHLSFTQLYHCCLSGTSRSFHLVRNLPEHKKRLFDHSNGLYIFDQLFVLSPPDIIVLIYEQLWSLNM